GTVMRTNGHLSAIVELEDEDRKGSVKKEIENAGIKFAEIRFISKIPRDPRHNSKIDYAKLKQIIEP
ncbi:MAG TPA: AMP-dependent synthetase, partial [Bacteroidia bacterium]